MEGSFIGDPEGYIKKALETDVFLHMGPFGGPGGDASLPGNLKER